MISGKVILVGFCHFCFDSVAQLFVHFSGNLDGPTQSARATIFQTGALITGELLVNITGYFNVK